MIDGEAVIMNMDSGHYFSARGLAGVLWEWTIAGHTLDAMTTAVSSVWPAEKVHDDVRAFVQSLQSHALVIAAPSAPASALAPDGALPATGRYEPPRLDVFTDMQDLLLLDPIHDVGEAGWPMPLPATVPESA